MDELLWLLSDGADWEALIFGPVNTLIALGLALTNRDTLKFLKEIKLTYAS